MKMMTQWLLAFTISEKSNEMNTAVSGVFFIQHSVLNVYSLPNSPRLVLVSNLQLQTEFLYKIELLKNRPHPFYALL